MNLLHKAKQNQEARMLEVTKSDIKLSADTAMLIGQTNFEILNYRRTKIMPELNYSYRQLSFNQGDHQNYSLEKIYQSKSKKYLKLTKWGLQFQESHSLLVALYQLPLINLHKIKSSLPFCTGAGRYQEEDLSTWRVSRNRTIKATGNSRANGTNPTARITIKNQSRNANTL